MTGVTWHLETDDMSTYEIAARMRGVDAASQKATRFTAQDSPCASRNNNMRKWIPRLFVLRPCCATEDLLPLAITVYKASVIEKWRECGVEADGFLFVLAYPRRQR